MKTFKTLAASLCLASCAFVAVPAHATIEPNGISINGISINGISINGISINGISINGISINGISINGTAATGIAAGTPVAVTLPPETAGR